MPYEREHPDEPQSARQKKHRRTTEEERNRMRTLRAAGTGVEEISRLLGFSLSVVNRWTSDVPVPKKRRTRAEIQVASDRAITRLERKQRRATDDEDRRWQASRPLPQRKVSGTATAPKKEWPFHFDADAEYDTAGPHIDPDLLLHAESILEQWIEGTAKGRLYERRININQATLIYASSIPLWNYEAFLRNREMWRVVRALSGVNSTELAARLDISPASISRYEKGDRSPATGLMRNLHEAYTELLEEALNRAEWNLVIDSYADVVIAASGTPFNELPDTMADVETWVAQGTDLEDFDIEHITHLAAARGWLPYPQWRTPTVDNLWLLGYPTAPALQHH